MSIDIKGWSFTSDQGDFTLENPHQTSYLYFPLANQGGIMSSITPTLHGDIKNSHNSFLTMPVSVETLQDSFQSRNFWLNIEGFGAWSAAGVSHLQLADTLKEEVRLDAGLLWHKLTRENPGLGLRSEIISFVPANSHKVELMKVTITNCSKEAKTFTATGAIPIYGRSADNLRDHRHVTSLLHRISTTEHGVVVKPTLSFDERGHSLNPVHYFVVGALGDGTLPIGFFPDIESFVGEGGSLLWPEAVVAGSTSLKAGTNIEGYEAVGALQFQEAVLQPGESIDYVIAMGMTENAGEIQTFVERYCTSEQFEEALRQNKEHWQASVSHLTFHSKEESFDQWMRWVAVQPILRRIYGCSFMPHHDYGRGGRGWRDLWQDCLALLVMDAGSVRELLLNNYSGVRIDGSNATIIGSKPGEFLADRNSIPRVWMDHGAWPFLTTNLYVNMSGDVAFLLEEQDYFKDQNIWRCKRVDKEWQENQGFKQLDIKGNVYKGSILEHILLQNLTAFFHVGEHNNIRLEGADWNDALDMARDKGESVAFTAMYAGNLLGLSDAVLSLKEKLGIEEVLLAEEMTLLLDTLSEGLDYDSILQKHRQLELYYDQCGQRISGQKRAVSIAALSQDLKKKGDWIVQHIRKQEWIKNTEGFEWFNGYYDNEGKPLEGDHAQGVRMTLTGQVFTIMNGIATDEQVSKITAACDRYLWDVKVGGYRLNTNFHELKLNMGRCFGFAFGHKENGAMFSHMAVMYANALYKRGFVKEGYKVLHSIYAHCSDFKKSRIYPGIPEYINERGRGMYHYLTGSASWYLYTMLSEAYGVKGTLGELVLEPKLVAAQFDDSGKAAVHAYFADRRLCITYENESGKDYGDYSIAAVRLKDAVIDIPLTGHQAVIPRTMIQSLDEAQEHRIHVLLQ